MALFRGADLRVASPLFGVISRWNVGNEVETKSAFFLAKWVDFWLMAIAVPLTGLRSSEGCAGSGGSSSFSRKSEEPATKRVTIWGPVNQPAPRRAWRAYARERRAVGSGGGRRFACSHVSMVERASLGSDPVFYFRRSSGSGFSRFLAESEVRA